MVGLLVSLFVPCTLFAQYDEFGWGADALYNQRYKPPKEEKIDTVPRFTHFTNVFEAGTAIKAGNRLPFYLTTNNHGLYSPEHSQAYIRAKSQFSVSKGKWSAEAGFDAIAYASGKSEYYGHNARIQQLYAQAKYGIYKIMIGCKEEDGEFVDPRLSSGNMVWSGNARPAPGIHFGMDDFAHMVIIDNIFESKVDASWYHLTDGDCNKTNYMAYRQNYLLPEGQLSAFYDDISDPRQHSLVQNAWIHHASAFLRTRSSWPFFLTVGGEHACMFGGRVRGQKNSQDYQWLMSAVGSKGKTEIGYNHLMSFNFRGDLNLKKIKLGIYKQHYTDDMEGGLFDSGLDGLWGLELKLPQFSWLSHLVVEMLYTTNQNGVVYANDIYQYDLTFYPQAGNSNFYHDEAYGAWTHYGLGLGNPLLASPIYNDDMYPDYQSNMIRAFHIGASGRIADIFDYILRIHHQESWGTPFAPFVRTRKNTSVELEADYTYGHWQFIPAVAFDHGDLFGNNFGLSLKARYKL